MKKRTSYHLTYLKDELRRRALKETNEDKRDDYWRMYYRAKNAEYEVRQLVMEAEIRRLIDFLTVDGRMGDLPMNNDDSTDEQQSPPHDKTIDDKDIPPHQKGLWD